MSNVSAFNIDTEFTDHYDKNNDNKITGYTDAEFDLINWGNAEDMVNFTDPNKVGRVKDKNDTTISDITPLIMLINASGEGWRAVAQALIAHGADPDMQVNYYNKTTTARAIADKYRGGL